MPWPDEACETCPRRAKGLEGPCLAQLTKHRRFCEFADPAHPDHLPKYLAILCDEEPEQGCGGGSGVVAVGREHRPADTTPRATATGTINATRELFARMKACPHWQKAQDCGCGINRCSLGKGDRGRVGHKDCFECLVAGANERAAEAAPSVDLVPPE